MFVANPEVIDEKRLRAMAREVRSCIKDIYLHWTAGYYGQDYDEYHLCIDCDGTVYVNCQSLLEFKQHTYQRNHGSVGIALCCGVDARSWLPDGCSGFDVEQAYEMPHCAKTECALIDFGPEPPTDVQIDVMAKVVAALCDELRLPITPETVMTHCEIAFVDGYGPGDGDPDMRWDLWFLPEPGSLGGALYPGGLLLRAKAQYYLDTMDEEAR